MSGLSDSVYFEGSQFMQEKDNSHSEISEIDIFYLLTFLSFILEKPGILGSLNPDEEKEFIEM